MKMSNSDTTTIHNEKGKNTDFVNNYRTNKLFVYFELARLFSKNFFKSFAGPFFTFGLPVFFLILFYFTMGVNSSTWKYVHGHDIIAGYIMLSSVNCGYNFLSGRICEWKESVFLKRLNVTPLKKWEFLLVIILFYSIISIIGTCWMIMWAMIVNPTHQIDNWNKYSNWGFMIIGIILNILVAISLGIFIGGISKSSSMGEGITMLLFFPSIFLTGIIIPVQTFGSSKDVINIIGYFIPFKYSVSAFLYGWWHQTANKTGSFWTLNTVGFDSYWQVLLGAILYPILLVSISLFTFKWDTK